MVNTLKIGWCDHRAALYAVKHWHYSGSLPVPPVVRVGVWEEQQYIGCVLFSRGSNNNMGKPYNLKQTEVCELTRVALNKHKTPVTRVLKIAIKLLKTHAPKLRLVVSYADPAQGHWGGIYQGGNWVYTGQTSGDAKYIDKHGREWHSRQVSKTGFLNQFGQRRKVPKHNDCKKILIPGKYRYLMPLDNKMAAQIKHLRKPYPKRGESIDSDAPAVHVGEGGAIPTSSLQNGDVTPKPDKKA